MHVKISRPNTLQIKIEFGKFKKSIYKSYLHFHNPARTYNLKYMKYNRPLNNTGVAQSDICAQF